LLVMGALPFWHKIQGIHTLRSALAGTNAAVVGLLGGALFTPVWTGAIHGRIEFAFMMIVSALLLVLKLPAWLVVILSGIAGWLILN
ncbi:MAG: chromate transporter, partial [Verrucomicrobiota bacterium]